MNTIRLRDLIKDFAVLAHDVDPIITGLALDSRFVEAGDLFFACAGGKTDGRHYIDEAIERGAAAVLCETNQDIPAVPLKTSTAKQTVPIIALPNLSQWVSHIASRFYGDPSSQFPIIGVTGTNGKTSCTHLLAQGYAHLGKRLGIIGTVGYGFLNALTESTHTTPDPVSVQRLLARFRSEGANGVAMEISSHSLVQGRVNGMTLDSAIFTNLTRDHLDYHHSMEEYRAAKRRLFDLPLKNRIINADDPTGLAWLKEFAKEPHVYAYTLGSPDLPSNIAVIKANRVSLSKTGLTMSVQTPWGDGLLRTSLLGRFNAANLLSVLTTLCLQGYALHDVLQALAYSKTVAGRMECFGNAKTPLIVVDYAHTPDALSQALMALREHCEGRLWCVFGCGGDRDRGKRALMGKASESYADKIIVTDDNPRYEDPKHIVQDILAGFETDLTKVTVIHTRDEAIKYAFQQASPQDIILVAGKGHENYQLVWGEKRSFSDRDYVASLLFAL
ncbi:MAG: hypothetical protein K0R12_994 [Gammaproteobacteria bacterium]|jgi:UDP-N-acetylmuramoyl-L-alanyl-D-glutamate--2,6-diaminopimelate ligase|nr:hypothetical protein [Gammaproteobacteria bacterium]